MKRKVLPPRVLALAMIFSVSIIGSVVISQTQPNQKRADRIETFKIGFLTKRMDLSTAESQKFWPLYNEHEKKIAELENHLSTVRGLTPEKLTGMSDKEVDDAMTRFVEHGQQIQDLRKKYHEDLKKILPIKKVALFYLAERDFKKELVMMAIERRNQRKE
jgi:hypothetical protein